jgi:acylphosphatase
VSRTGAAIRHVALRIEGRVQGVGFRWSARARAVELGVSGFVRNEDDGSVTIEAEAEEAVLESFQEWCRQGPRSASVDRVLAKPGTVKGFAGFEIRD